MDLAFKAKLLARTMEELNNKVILVEGERDKAALRTLGIQSPVIIARGKDERVVQKAIEQSENENGVTLLFDFDAEGQRKTKAYNELLKGVTKIDEASRRHVRTLFGITTIEELPTALKQLQQKIAGKGEQNKWARHTSTRSNTSSSHASRSTE